MESVDAARLCSVESITCCLLSFSVECLHAIVVTDRDGVPVIKGEDLSLNPSVFCFCFIVSVTEFLGTFPPKPPEGLHRVSQYAFDYKEKVSF